EQRAVDGVARRGRNGVPLLLGSGADDTEDGGQQRGPTEGGPRLHGSLLGLEWAQGGDLITPSRTLPSPLREAGQLFEGGAEGGGHLRGGRGAAEVRRADAPAAQDPVDGGQHAVVRLPLAEVIEHQRARPYRSHRVGDAPARDVGRR